MNTNITNGYRKLGVGEKLLLSDYYAALDGALEPIADSQAGNLVTADDLCDFYRDTHSRPILTFDITPKEGVPAPETARTDDDGKAPLANVPWAAVREMALVQLYGKKKYDDWNNFRKGMEVSRNLSCAIRHVAAYMEGEDNDPESHRSHLGHALCRIAFVLQNMADGVAVDDRYVKP